MRKRDLLVVVSAVIALFVILWFFSPKPSNLETLETFESHRYESKPVLKVIVGRFNRDEFGYCHVYGEVKNVGLEDAEFVKVIAAFYDKDENIVGSSFTYTNPSSIPAGGSAPFHMVWMDKQGCGMARSVKVWVESR